MALHKTTMAARKPGEARDYMLNLPAKLMLDNADAEQPTPQIEDAVSSGAASSMKLH